MTRSVSPLFSLLLISGAMALTGCSNAMNAPEGQDPADPPVVSTAAPTAVAAAGAQIVLFSTGRGTPFASPVPTV